MELGAVVFAGRRDAFEVVAVEEFVVALVHVLRSVIQCGADAASNIDVQVPGVQ